LAAAETQAQIAVDQSVATLNNVKAKVLENEAHVNMFQTGLEAATPLPVPAAPQVAAA